MRIFLLKHYCWLYSSCVELHSLTRCPFSSLSSFPSPPQWPRILLPVHYFNWEYTAKFHGLTWLHNLRCPCAQFAAWLDVSSPSAPLSQTKLVTYGSHNWTANIRHIRHISTFFLYPSPPPPNFKDMYTNMCVQTVHSQLLQWVALRMTELVTHSPVAALIPREREKRVKRMMEDDDRDGVFKKEKPFVFLSGAGCPEQDRSTSTQLFLYF